ncbi:MAG: hypothetical protein O2866_05465 [archaeon]|nr:hypothetical protein [archaeon]MDA1168314.1 hypothetical protein [archaeon]
MYSMDDLKENRNAQITVACIAFFLIAFPTYFSVAAERADGSLGGGVGDYKVNGEVTYVTLDSGAEYVADGTPWSGTFSTDALNGADNLNIVGVRVSLSYGEDEQGRGLPACGSQTAADTISGSATHGEFSNSANGQNGGGSGSHDVTVEWFNSSMVEAVVKGLSVNEIKSQIDSMGAGLGQYDIEISVDAQGDSCINPLAADNEDNGEDVSYTIELMVFDYTIVPYIEIQEE